MGSSTDGLWSSSEALRKADDESRLLGCTEGPDLVFPLQICDFGSMVAHGWRGASPKMDLRLFASVRHTNERIDRQWKYIFYQFAGMTHTRVSSMKWLTGVVNLSAICGRRLYIRASEKTCRLQLAV